MLDFLPIEVLGLSTKFLVVLSMYVVLGVYAVFSGILYYHWKNYSSNLKVTASTFVVYLGTTLPLVFIMVVLSLNT